MSVGRICVREVDLAAADENISAALGVMRAAGVRRLPVVDRQRKLVGVVTLDDVLTLLAEEFALIGGTLARQKP